MVMDYSKNAKLFEELRGISKKYDISFWTAQQPKREFSGYQIETRLSPHTGESRYVGFFPMDHVNLI